MSNTLLTQGHKVAIAAGGQVPARLTQGHKIVLLTVGSVPSRVTQGHKVVLFNPSAIVGGAIRFGQNLVNKVFRGTTPVARVYAGESLTFIDPSET
jgi:hypothetical protein